MAAASVWYALIDAAQDQRLAGLLRGCKDAMCLFKGEIHPKLAAASPWLVRIDEADPLLPAWQDQGRGRNWGVLLRSTRKIDELHRHFRRFLQAKLPDGTVALFRFYDPRVFNAYIRAAEPEERAPWFEGVDEFVAETQGGAMNCHYALIDGQMQMKEQPAG